MSRKNLSWNPVKTAVKKVLNQYHPEAVKAEIIWDHVKTGMPDTQITRETIYEVLSRMHREGEIERVSTGWYQLPGKEKTPNSAWKMGYDEGYKKMKEKMMQIFLDKLALEAQKVHPDPRRIQLVVEMMREITGGRRDANS